MLAIYQVQCITGIPLHTNMQSDRLRFHSTVTTLHMGEIIYQIDQHNYGWIRRKNKFIEFAKYPTRRDAAIFHRVITKSGMFGWINDLNWYADRAMLLAV